MIVRVKEMPLPRFKALLARVWDLQWKEQGARSLLYASETALAGEERLREAERERERKERRETFRRYHAVMDAVLDHARDGQFESSPEVTRFLREWAGNLGPSGPFSPVFRWGMKVAYDMRLIEHIRSGEEIRLPQSQIPERLMEQFRSEVKPGLSPIPQPNRAGVTSDREFTLVLHREREETAYTCTDGVRVSLNYPTPRIPGGAGLHGERFGGGEYAYRYVP